jgi:tetratricopeptide (TPR) repeat protein
VIPTLPAAFIGFHTRSVSSWALSHRRITSLLTTMSRLFFLAFSSVLLVACAAQSPVPEQAPAIVAEPDAAAEDVPERPIPSDSLYPLLLAEFALRRQAYDVALNQYMEQSLVLRDAGVSAHTTYLTQFLQREAAAFQSALLWVELAPDNIEANNTLAELLIRRGLTVEALPHLAEVERQGGFANFPLLTTGLGELSEARRTELAQGINALSIEFPNNSRILLTQALIHTENQHYEQALDKLDALLSLEPEKPQALLLEARILIEQEAGNPYARLQRVLKDNPDAKLLRLQYAGMLTGTDMNAARQQFEILSAQAPRDADLLFSLALINREIGELAASRTYLQQSIALGQRVNEAHYYLGRLAEEEGDTEQAINHYTAVKSGDEYLAANDRVGQILVDQKQLDRSRDWFNQQRKKNPELRAPLYGLEADILTRADYEKDAMRVFDQALLESPDSTPLRYARAMLSEKQNDLVSMERDLRAILVIDPDNSTALNALGYTLADRTNRYAEAQELISRALALQPDEPAILDSMGWVMYRTGRYDESVKFLSRAYENFPDPEVAAHLGEVLWVKGETDAAKEIWRDALQRNPGHPTLTGTLDRLSIDMPLTTPVEDASAGSPL